MNDEVRDQLAHAAGAILAMLPLALFPGPIAGAFGGFAIGMVRELTEAAGREPIRWGHVRTVLHGKGPRLDLCCWTAGGLIVGLVA